MGRACGGNFCIVFSGEKGTGFWRNAGASLCCAHLGKGENVWDCVLETVLGNHLLALLLLLHEGKQWNSCVAEGAPLSLRLHFYLGLGCTALWLPVSAWWINQKRLIYFVCSNPYPSQSYIPAPFCTSDYHRNHKRSLVGFSWAWKLQVSGSLVDVSHLNYSFLPIFSQSFIVTFLW